jgi:hypothetical protein
MNLTLPSVLAITVFATACGGGGTPDAGATVATISQRGTPINANVDGGAVYVILIDDSSVLQMAVERVSSSGITDLPLATTDWSDYAMSGLVGLNPTQTALVRDGKAYFLGAYGVTVVPLDGSPSTILYQPLPVPVPGHAFSVLGAFTVDAGSVYVCYRDTPTGLSDFGRFNPDGTWELLYTGSLPGEDETCYGGGITSDEDAVYWATSDAIRAYNKHDGTVTTVVGLGGLTIAPSPLAVSGDSLVWFDWFDAAFHAASKAATTPDSPAALGATTLFRLAPTDFAPFSMIATSTHFYWLSEYDLYRLRTVGGQADALAHHEDATDVFRGLAADDQKVYFLDYGLNDGGPGTVTLRSQSL